MLLVLVSNSQLVAQALCDTAADHVFIPCGFGNTLAYA
jgi:hypothetical protein